MNLSCFFKLVQIYISEIFVNFYESSIFENPYKIFDFSQAFSKIIKRDSFVHLDFQKSFWIQFF
ncbi:hypothetical protein DD603_24230 [Enterobacter cloacae complex sp. 2DZ2F2B]|nr:hypothetical protein DD603_24230 [Enterobacter cloacae complex sp. 2DZ2F2B]